MSDEDAAGSGGDEPPVEGWPAESAERAERARALRARGINPYPNRYDRTHGLAEIVAAHGEQSLEELERLAPAVRIAGRVMTQRGHGKASFLTLSDGDGRLQVYVRQDDVGEQAYGLLELVDRGDFLGVAGHVMRTRKGELSVQARELTFLSKALLPPPEEMARAGRRGGALPPALPRPHGQSRGAPHLRRPQPDRGGDPPLHGRAGLHRGRDADDAAHRGRRGGPTLRHPPQRARHRPLPAHRARAVPQAPGGRRPREGVRDQPELPQRGDLGHAQPRVHDAGVLHRVPRRGRGHGHHGGDHRGRGGEGSGRAAHRLQGARGLLPAALRAAHDEGGGAARGLGGGTRDGGARSRRSRAALGLGGRRRPDGAAATRRARPLGPERYAGLSHGKLVAQLFEDLAEHTYWDPTFITDYPTEVSPLSKARPDDPTTTERFELYVAGMEIATASPS